MMTISRLFVCALLFGVIQSSNYALAASVNTKVGKINSVSDLSVIELLGEQGVDIIVRATKPVALSYGENNEALRAQLVVNMLSHNWYTPYFLPYPSEGRPMISGCMLEQSYEARHRVTLIEAGSIGVSNKVEFRTWQRHGEGFGYYRPTLKDQYQEVRIFFNNTILYCGLLSDSPAKGSALSLGQLQRFLNNSIGLKLNVLPKVDKQPSVHQF